LKAEKLNNPANSQNLHRFTDFLFDVATKLVCVSSMEIRAEIDKALEAASDFLDLESLFLSEFSKGKEKLTTTHIFLTKKPRRQLPRIDMLLSCFMERLRAGQIVHVKDAVEDLYLNAVEERELCIGQGIKSFLMIPVRIDSVQAVLSVYSLHSVVDWNEVLVSRLSRFAGILAGAVERKKEGQRIQELLQFEHLLSEISATYINLPVDEIEKVLRRDLGRLALLLKVDRCLLYVTGEDRHSFRLNLPLSWWPEEDREFVPAVERSVIADPGFYESFEYCFDKWRKGGSLKCEKLDDLPSEAEGVRNVYRELGVHSFLSTPMFVGGLIVGALVISTTRANRAWADDLVPQVRLFGEVFANALMRKQHEEKIHHTLLEVKQLKERIEADYTYLREEINLEHDSGEIIGKTEALKQVLVKIRQVSPTNATVLLLGETGTGKGLIARAIHNASKRKDRPLVQVNCAALTPTLIESELFGHEKGAFTGAQTKRVGRFEIANGTTLFLDEIGELPLELQPKLLRVLQDGEFERVGGSETIKIDVRVIAATNRDLEKEIEAGRFRRDLWYRLSIFPVAVPPLRERLEDIPLFVRWFVDRYGKWIGKQFDIISHKTIKALQSYSWPGNIRELENIIERAVITSPEGNLHVELPLSVGTAPDKGCTLEEIERGHILKVLQDTDWIIEGPRGAARRLGLNPSTLRFRAKKLDIRRPNLTNRRTLS
jgi:formate hydrogenlyase transcriptional activator